MVTGMRRTNWTRLVIAAMIGGSSAAAQPPDPAITPTRAMAVELRSPDATEVLDLEEEAQAEEEEAEEVVYGEPISLFDPGGAALSSFHRALRRAEAGEGQARVLVYGASHVAADSFTHVIREGLQARFGNAGHGFILPARGWRYYRHRGIGVESSRRWNALRVRASTRDVDHLGLYGIAMVSDSARDWGRLDLGQQTASRFELYYWRQPGGGDVDVYLDGRRVRRLSTEAAEPGPDYAVFNAEDAHHVFEVRIRGNGPVRLFGVSMEREVPGAIVDTLGINGARASSHLYWEEALYRAHLRRRDPSLVVLAYGTNESGDDSPIEDYEATLRSVVARVRSTVPNASCLLIGPSDRPARENDEVVDRPRTHQVIDAQRRVSRDFGCAFFDLVAFGGGPLHMVEWAAAEPPFAQRDLVHYTHRGYRRLGEVLFDALMADFDETPPFEPTAPEPTPFEPTAPAPVEP